MSKMGELNSQMAVLAEECREQNALERQNAVLKSMKSILEINMNLYEKSCDNKKKYNVLRMILDVFLMEGFENTYDFPAILYNVMFEDKHASFHEFYGRDAQKYILQYIVRYKLDEQDKNALINYDCSEAFKEEFISELRRKAKEGDETKSKKKKSPAWTIVFGVLGACCLALGLVLAAFGVFVISSNTAQRNNQLGKLEKEIHALEDEIAEKEKEIENLTNAGKDKQSENQDGSVSIETGKDETEVSTYVLDKKRNLQKEPTVESDLVLPLEEGMEVSIVGTEEGDWYEVLIKGYLKLEDFKPTDSQN